MRSGCPAPLNPGMAVPVASEYAVPSPAKNKSRAGKVRAGEALSVHAGAEKLAPSNGYRPPSHAGASVPAASVTRSIELQDGPLTTVPVPTVRSCNVWIRAPVLD